MVGRDYTILFVDGHYLRSRYKEWGQKCYSDETAVADLSRLVSQTGPFFRAYFYDCVDDPKSDLLTGKIHKLEAWHLRLGKSIKINGIRKRQKQVDVQLAVDMLSSAAQGFMSRAILFAGDSDFVPIVVELVRMGVFVTLCYDKRSIASDLIEAADRRIEWTHSCYYETIDQSFRERNLPIQDEHGVHALSSLEVLDHGNTTSGITIIRYFLKDKFYIGSVIESEVKPRFSCFENRAFGGMDHLHEERYGERIHWNTK